MIVASALPFRYRTIVGFQDVASRNRLMRFLDGLEGKVAVMENVPRMGYMICDFDRQSERDAFQKATQSGVPAPAVLRRRYDDAILLAA